MSRGNPLDVGASHIRCRTYSALSETFLPVPCCLYCRPSTSSARAASTAAGRVITAASRATTAVLQTAQTRRTTFPIAVVFENRMRQVGIASIDMLRTYTIDLLQISDNQSYTQTMAFLQLLDPVDVVLCNSQHDRLLFRKIQEHFASEANSSSAQVSAIHRKFFDEVEGEEAMKGVSSKPLGSLALGGDIGTTKYLALASLNALLKVRSLTAI